MKYEKEVKEFLQKQAHVKLAYLFGSVALQKAGKLSDIDIGIFLDESLEKKEKFKIKLKLISDLENILKNNRIDLVIMNDASISLNFEIIKANYPLFIQNKNLKVDLEQYIISRYLDRQYYDKRWADSLIKKTAK
ncbi:type VII toxin-antitoxin system MntA family adenylyltransferase antitoxin [Methanobacterium veterum]|uniref:protein adenylyltransferase n=1 Tax=Methanobacterium veterum TaxID=408577 RepID=A0A9E4ZX58_9EURY|nr:nucleotidyltransferase domain-containing protein [Methanobacterium veterum]MCZ3365721.1 nucleotidyltransferase domain-containing protein [Methanobacterium veterum]MCZ3371185.1 nucleotidyltransferase domain-containing protein [Methanobacterium veterum]